ncbi:MAG: nucleotidyltransferase [Cyclobacteriaceae bacterium]|nr:nucleotidyltransferase [Cyclobacteriaceae bacterium]
MDLSLVIMAAGIGSRYGGVKQLEGIGPNGETIMDYSLHDAIRNGYKKVVFIIRKELQEAFDHHYRDRFRGMIGIDYVYQDEFKKYEDQYEINRSKPWGTAHAMLSSAPKVDTPFAILNADDFYGAQAFRAMAGALRSNEDPHTLFLMGYKLVNTLSDYGTVSRGVCAADRNNYLVDVKELTKIGKRNGEIYFEDNGEFKMLQPHDPVSMNFWGFSPWIFEELDRQFRSFIEKNHDNPKAEFYIPSFVDKLIKDNKARVKVLPTDETWLGVTYQEDKPVVINGISEFIDRGLYPKRLG